MPKLSKGLFLDSASNPTTYKLWTAALDDTIYSEHIMFSNPPYEVGLWSLLMKTTDTGGETPTITAKIEFGIDPNGTYYDGTALTLSDIHGNASFTSGQTFVCRLDAIGEWLFGNGFRISLTRGTADNVLTINYAEVVAI